MSKIIERLQQFAESQYDSMREFERDSKVTQGVFSKSFSKGSEIRTDSLEKFAENFPQVSAEWLLRGVGEVLIQNKEPVAENPTLDFVVKYLTKQIEELKSQIDDLGTQNKQLKKERDDLLISNKNLQYMLNLARKGEIASVVTGSSDAGAV